MPNQTRYASQSFMFFLIGSATLFSGCTVVQVNPIDRTAHDLHLVCIEQNNAVHPAGFLPMLEQRFAEHGIATRRYNGKPFDDCEYTASYDAHSNWDIAVYLTDAKVEIRKGGEVVGRAIYHLRNKGGLDLGKWSSAESKMQPVLDKLLSEYTAISGGHEAS